MKIFKLSEKENVALVMSAREVVGELPRLKQTQPNVISIRDSEATLNKEMIQLYNSIDNAGLENLFVIEFDDLETPFDNKMGLIFPTQDKISEILDWAKQKWQLNNKPFIVHCTAGVSRSAAVAMLINQMIQNDFRAGWDMKLHSPNQKVLEFGEKHLGIEPFRHVVKQETTEFDKKRLENGEDLF